MTWCKEKFTLPSMSALVHPSITHAVDTVETGSAWFGAPQGLPSGETQYATSPYRMRGFAPRPGISEVMLRADPQVYSGLDKQLLTLSALKWDILPPADATDEELAQTRWANSMYQRLDGGFISSAIARPTTARLHGFSISEKVWAIDDKTGLWRLDKLLWIAPWAVKAWVLDVTGHAIGIVYRDAVGTESFISWDKIHYEGQMFWGRNYEGVGLARPLKYYWDHKREIMVSDAVARERASAGIPYAEPPPSVDEDEYPDQFAQMDQLLRHILTGETAPTYVLPANGWQVGVNYLDGMPDNQPMLAYIDHAISTQMTDNLSELGTNKYGARAVGTEMRLDKFSMFGGLCAIKSHNIDQSIHSQLYELNGWDTDRLCRTQATGLEDEMAKLRLVLETLTAEAPTEPLVPMTPEINDQIRRALGLTG